MTGKKRAAGSTANGGVVASERIAPSLYSSEGATDDAVISSAFGEANRIRLIEDYFASATAPITPATAWAHVYRMLLWTDRTTGLAHCYESDKSQPGKPWYARSLAFHGWLAGALGTTPPKVAGEIDWMFQKAAAELAAEVMRRSSSLLAIAAKQRQPYAGEDYPAPGEDPELISIVREAVGGYLHSEPSIEDWGALVQRVRQHLTLDNKRKNLLGEGFEDVLSAVIRRTRQHPSLEVHTRRLLHELPGFNRARSGAKPNKVDLAVITPAIRTLVTAKWSVRADREKQFVVDYEDYIQAESDGKRFDYVFVTNEFDPARLMRACENLRQNAHMFTHVVHLSTDALRATYGTGGEESMRRVVEHIASGRLISLEKWLAILAPPAEPRRVPAGDPVAAT